MITKQQKRSTTVNTVSWSTALEDDSGIQFAAMTGSLDASHPLGQMSFTVHNEDVYRDNAKEAKQAYADFIREVTETAEGFVGSTVIIKGEDVKEKSDKVTKQEE